MHAPLAGESAWMPSPPPHGRRSEWPRASTDVATGGDGGTTSVVTRGCQGYIHQDYIRTLYPNPLRIRAGDAHPNCIMRKGGEDICILSDRNCEIIISDPYPRYESQDTEIYTVTRLAAPG